MFPVIFGLIAVAVGLYLIARWWTQATPQQLASAVRWTAIALAAGVILFAALSRRWALLLALAVPAWMLYRRRQAGAAGGGAPSGGSGGSGTGGPSGHSAVETRFLRMTLDHASGAMAGEVVAGEFAGRTLDELALGELIALWRTCVAEDEASRTVLETWLDRVHGDTWRQAAGGAATDRDAGGQRESPWSQSGISDAEAREILGVDEGADRAAIEAAYRKAMQRAHPDHGGSDWYAARVNAARDRLLKP